MLDAVCKQKKLKLHKAEESVQGEVMQDAFCQYLLHFHAYKLRLQLSPIYVETDDIALLRITAANKRNWQYADTPKKPSALLQLFMPEISRLKLPSIIVEEINQHKYRPLLPDEWLNHHIAK